MEFKTGHAMIAVAVLIVLLFGFVGCASKEISPPDPATVLENMAEHKTEYIGDASKVSALVGCLPTVDTNFTQNMIALQTEEEPFGLMIFYEPAKGRLSPQPPQAVSDTMQIYAGYLFENVGNMGYVEYAFRTSPSDGVLDIPAYETVYRVDKPE